MTSAYYRHPRIPEYQIHPRLPEAVVPTGPAPDLAAKSVWRNGWDNLKYYVAYAVSSVTPTKVCPNWSKSCVQSVTQHSQVEQFLGFLRKDTQKALELLSGSNPINPNTKYHGKTLLEHACDCGNAEVVSALLARRVSITPALATKLLPIVVDWPPHHSKAQIIKELLIFGATLDAATKTKLEEYGISGELRNLYQGALEGNTLEDVAFVQAVVRSNCFDIDFQRDIITSMKSIGVLANQIADLLIQAALTRRVCLFVGANRRELLELAIESENKVLLAQYVIYSNIKNPTSSSESITTPALAQALQKRKLTSAVYLLEAGHTIHPRDATPQLLLRAVQLQSMVAITTLLKAGVSRFAHVNGTTVLRFAYENKLDQSVAALTVEVDRPSSQKSKLVQDALERGDFTSAVYLLYSDPSIYSLAKKDITPKFLLEAVKMQKPDAIEALLDRGASMAAVIDGKSILQHALDNRSAEACGCLIEHNQKSRQIEFPTHFICEHFGAFRSSEDRQPFRYLIRIAGDNPFAKDKQGRTPISILAAQRNIAAIQEMLSNCNVDTMGPAELLELSKVIRFAMTLPETDERDSLLNDCLTLCRGNLGAIPFDVLLNELKNFEVLDEILADPEVMDASTALAQKSALNDRANMVKFLEDKIFTQKHLLKDLSFKLAAAQRRYAASTKSPRDAALLKNAYDEFYKGIAAIEDRLNKLQALIDDIRDNPFTLAQKTQMVGFSKLIADIKQDICFWRIKPDYSYTLPVPVAMRTPLHANKQVVYDALTARTPPTAPIAFSKHSLGDVDAVRKMHMMQNKPVTAVEQAGNFAYPAGDATTVHWTANYAGQELFQDSADGSLTQSALQVAEHPGMLHLRAELQRRPGTSRLEGDQVALIKGAKRHGRLDMQGTEFASASERTVRGKVTKFAVPTESNMFAMTAPQIGRDLAGQLYRKEHLEQMFLRAYTAFAAIKAQNPGKRIVIHTGAFGGNDKAAVFCQLAAARCAGIDEVRYYSQDQSADFQEAENQYNALLNDPNTPRDMTVDNYLDWLASYAEKLKLHYRA